MAKGNNDAKTQVSWGVLGFGYAAVLLFSVLAYYIAQEVDVAIEIGSEYISLAVFYVVAQAVERLVEPLMGTGPTKSPDAADAKAKLRSARALQAADSETVLAKEKVADKVHTERAVIAWALASCAALIVCALLGLGLIDAVADVTSKGTDGEPDESWHGLDVVVTGLAVGAGTKPLHDLIKRIEKAKEKAAGV